MSSNDKMKEKKMIWEAKVIRLKKIIPMFQKVFLCRIISKSVKFKNA